MTKPLKNKIAIITGGGRGLGKAMAIGLAKAGASGLCITGSSSVEQLKQVAREIKSLDTNTKVLPVIADVTNPDACLKAANQACRALGPVDILINNAGKGQNFVADDHVPFWQAKTLGWKEIIETNVNGPFFMARAVVESMITSGWGRIINISKSRDSMHRPKNSPYGPSKAALEAMTLSWAQDLSGTGVTVNTLAPGGSVDTGFVLPAVREKINNKKITKKFFDAEVIVPAAVWLASGASDGITGCRYVGAKWNAELPDKEAAEIARESAIFQRPTRDSNLKKTWTKPGF